MASGVPVVATGRGGPLDLVENSRTGWLYEPGDLAGLRRYVMDLMGDDAKRRAFAAAAHASVQGRTWPALSAELVRHYQAVIDAAAGRCGRDQGASPADQAGQEQGIQPVSASSTSGPDQGSATSDRTTEGVAL
jgi:phosphatidylinositol alpha 1,6-mannosyltransferase